MINKIIRGAWLAFMGGWLFFLLLIGCVRVNLFGLFGELPGLEILENPKTDEASLLYSSDGEVLGSYYREKRTPVEYDALPKHLVDALIATEDERFEEHSGVDFKGTFAIFYYLLQGKKRGSSTLSQQTAKNLFQLRDFERYQGVFSGNMLITKIKEWIVAIRIERAYTKREILTMYLNTVSFGRNTFGIKNAAETFFNVAPEKLRVDQAALLIGLLKGPSVYDPIRKPERALERRNTVLGQMLKGGFITGDERRNLINKPLGLNYQPEGEAAGLAPYLRGYLRPFIQKWAREHNQDLYGGGLKIYTTIDAKMQVYLEQAAGRHMKALQWQYNQQWKSEIPWEDPEFIQNMARKSARYQEYKNDGLSDKECLAKMKEPVQMTLFGHDKAREGKISPMDSIKYMAQILHTGALSVDPRSGRIRAYVGDINYKYFKYDNVWQSRRQAGSTFKPFVYAYAIEEAGLTPCSEVLDVEVAYPWKGTVWTPRNSDNSYSNNAVTLKYGLAKSVNTVAANLMMRSGPDNIVKFARKLGLESPMEAVPALALGATDVSLFEMVAAYCVFVNGGTYIRPHALTRIEDKYGNVLYEFKPDTREAITERTAAYMVELLKAGSEFGTSRRLKSDFGIDAEIGGKTGTTQNSADGWFIGISPELVTGVWVGGSSRDVRVLGGSGASLAMPIWGYYMGSVFRDRSLDVRKKGYGFSLDDVYQNCDEGGSSQPEPLDNIDEHMLID